MNDFISLESLIIEKRIYEELIIFREKGSQYAGIRWKLNRQALVTLDGRSYDQMFFDVSAHREDDFENLKKELEEGMGKPGFSVEAHIKKHFELQCHYLAEYWFDITGIAP